MTCATAAASTAKAHSSSASGALATAKAGQTVKHASMSSTSPAFGSRVLRQGMQGHDVGVLQAYLTLAGFPTSIDGGFGPLTAASVKAFKAANRFRPANGIAGLVLQHALLTKVKAVEADPPRGAARINADGTATAPAGAPAIVQKVIAAANQIIHKPYVYGGGHASFNASGYDCSGAVSHALHGGGLLAYPEASTALESFGSPGKGRWITVYANASHAFVVVAGRAFDTANFGGPNIPAGSGPRWRSNPTGNLYDGTGRYIARHPAGL